jgi:hypothetical protein
MVGIAATLLSGGTKQWLGELLLVVAFGEVANRNAIGFGPTMDSGDIGFADLAKGRPMTESALRAGDGERGTPGRRTAASAHTPVG